MKRKNEYAIAGAKKKVADGEANVASLEKSLLPPNVWM